MRYMLDTNTLVYVLNARSRHQALIERFRQESVHNMVFSSVALAELRYGVEKSVRHDANRAALRRLLDTLNVVPFDQRAAERYGTVRTRLEAAGTPIGPLDTMIAAHAACLNLILVTNNVREFSRVQGLHVENWIAD